MEASLTSDPDNKNEKFRVERAETHHRKLRSDPATKFALDIAAKSLKKGNPKGRNWLKKQWQKRYCGKTRDIMFFPSINEMIDGIKKEEKKNFLQTSGLDENSKEFKQALANLHQVWDDIFADFPEAERDVRIKY